MERDKFVNDYPCWLVASLLPIVRRDEKREATKSQPANKEKFLFSTHYYFHGVLGSALVVVAQKASF